MRAPDKSIIAASLSVFLAASAMPQTPIVYPAKNQSADQQKKDEGECGTWAKQNTGVDPAVLASSATAPAPAAATPAAPPPKGPQGERVRGAARGAAAGAVVGEVADNDADQGAATGAVVGAVAGGSRARREKSAQEKQAAEQQQQATAQQQQAQQQADAEKQAQMATYTRAYSACLEGRGYTLK